MVAEPQPHLINIGKMAGMVWTVLDRDGAMSMSALVKKIGLPRDMVMQGIGWLAREDKIDFKDEGRMRIVFLREHL